MEKIKSAAIKYQLRSNPGEDLFVTGPNHGYCISCFSAMDLLVTQRIPESEVQGFITSEGRFVDRSEAYQIAKESGQLIRECDRKQLDSYNVNF